MFGKHWSVKNDLNYDDCKMMHWLMTCGNHATVDTVGKISNYVVIVYTIHMMPDLALIDPNMLEMVDW